MNNQIIGTHIVDYGQTLEDMIVAGNYDWRNSKLTADRFLINGKGQVEFEHTIFHFDEDMPYRDVIVKITVTERQNPWLPARTENLLMYGAENPDEQRKYRIVALGSVGVVLGRLQTPCLDTHDQMRTLNLSCIDRDLDSFNRFLAVREVVRK